MYVSYFTQFRKYYLGLIDSLNTEVLYTFRQSMFTECSFTVLRLCGTMFTLI